MGASVSRSDFEWVYNDQPHTSRREAMLKKYPQIKKLFGHDPRFKYIVLGMVLTQIFMLPIVSQMPWWLVIALAYCFGGVINHSLMLAIHEISHNMAYGYSRPLANRLFGMVANLPIAIPMSISFKKYHGEHHRYLANEMLDPDVPTELEARLFSTSFGKFIWLVLQPVFYSFRPLVRRPKKPTGLEILNFFVQIAFDLAVMHFFGSKGFTYLLAGSLLVMGIHPVAGHFVAEHYMFRKGYETYSYYGPLNLITFNVGYHVEHHDFPAIPGSKLPEVRKIAPEFYDNLPHHNSWIKVLYDFITDPDIGPYARIKRRYAGQDKLASD